MIKSKLEAMIARYNLNGEVESVFLESKDNELSVDFGSRDRTVKGFVRLKDVDGFPEGKFGIHSTVKLKKLLAVLDSVVTVSTNGINTLDFTDKSATVRCMLAVPAVISRVPSLKSDVDFNTISVDLSPVVCSKVIKAFNALDTDDGFTFLYDKRSGGRLVINHSTSISNTVTVNVEANTELDDLELSFSSKLLKTILSVNDVTSIKEFGMYTNGRDNVSKIVFDDDMFECVYYLI